MLRTKRRSGYEQAEAELSLVEPCEVAVTLSPPARVKILAQAAHRPLLGLRSNARPHRARPAHMFLQVCLGPAPVRLEEAVGAVPRDEHRLRPAPDRPGQPRQPARVVNAGDLRQVVPGEPEPPAPGDFAGVVGEHHHAAGHAPHLAQARDRVLPVVDSAERHRGVEGLVLERQALGGGGHARRRALGAQRPAGAAPCVDAVAESLPFEDQSFDAAMAFATIDHWQDPIAGLRELRRVARRVVAFIYDASDPDRFWLNRDYLPEFAGLWAGRPSLAELAGAIGARAEPVLVPWDCADGFYHAYWRRPEAYLDDDVRRGMSIWARVGPAAEQRAVRSLRDDLASGRWAERNRDLADLDAADLGDRLLIA